MMMVFKFGITYHHYHSFMGGGDCKAELYASFKL